MTADLLDFGVAHADRLYIDGDWVAADTSNTIDVFTPMTGERIFGVAEAGIADVERAVAAARAAFDDGPWPLLSPAERAGYLREIGRQLAARTDSLSFAWTSQVGTIKGLADGVTGYAAGLFGYYADLADDFAFEEVHQATMGPEYGLLRREPVGVVAAITPWNAPLLQAVLKLAPALLAGCTVVLKCSPETPIEAYLLAEAIAAAGLPRGVVNMLPAHRQVSEALVRHPDVDKVSFTGSCAAGKRIASICGERIARCTLELGGKSAALVLDDYDVAKAAASIASSTTLISGQVCASLTRVIVSRDRHDELVEAFAAAFGAIRVGDPFDPASAMGPLATRMQYDRVNDYIAIGSAEGATLASGGGTPNGLDRGYYIEPTIFANVDNGSRLAREEIFGPVVSIIPARDEADAVRIANDSPFGLAASVFTDDADRAYALAKRLRSGTIGHNGLKSDFGIAFGGFKQSGIGREGGREGLLPFLEAKTVLLDTAPAGR